MIFRKSFDHKKSITEHEVMLIFLGLELDHLNKNGLRLLSLFSKGTDSVNRKVSYGLSHFGGKIILSIISAIYDVIIHIYNQLTV